MLPTLYAKCLQWLFEPPDSVPGRSLGPALKVLRYPYALVRDLTQGQLTLRAMSLVYTTLLSLAPFLALAFSVLKGLGYDQDLEIVVYQFLEPIGSGKATELTNKVMGFVNGVRGGVLGPISLAFLIYTVVSTIQKVEECFNFIWQVEKPRSWARRFSEYLSVMVIGPVFIVALVGVLHSQTFIAFSNATGLSWTLTQLKQFSSFLLVSGALMFLYRFIPNTTVKFSAAAIGAVAAGGLWTTGGVLFARFVASSSQTALIYAGFAIVIVALVWLYTSWLILLLGAQIAFYVQHPQTLRTGHRELHLTAALYERLGLAVMYLIARDYRSGVPHWTLNSLCEHFNVPAKSLSPVIAMLEAHDLLVSTDTDRLLPGRDPAQIRLHDIMDVLRNDLRNPRIPRVRGTAPVEAITEAMRRAMADTLGQQTLADLVR